MVALESHIEEALDRQLSVTKDSPVAASAVQRFHDMVKGNREALKARQAEIGSTAGNPVVKVGSALLGKAAGLIDKVRSEGVSKSLRDDYTAFNLAAVGHTMLHTTAVALGDKATADLAARCLTGHASAIQEINHIIEDVVMEELRKDNLPIVDAGAADKTRTLVDKVWKATDASDSKTKSTL
ncbi:MAG: hypothetical protein M3411_03445 [Chloroflexota bacterium]|nr:hypothetical protein [Chloroflexota bacterium]